MIVNDTFFVFLGAFFHPEKANFLQDIKFIFNNFHKQKKRSVSIVLGNNSWSKISWRLRLLRCNWLCIKHFFKVSSEGCILSVANNLFSLCMRY